jgi:hypothetical protein
VGAHKEVPLGAIAHFPKRGIMKELELKNLYEEKRKANDNSLSFVASHADCIMRGTSIQYGYVGGIK